MNNNMKMIDTNERCAAPDADDLKLEQITIKFAVPVYLSSSAQGRLATFIASLVAEPKNTPTEGRHWLFGVSGTEGRLCFESGCRSFNSEEERARVLEERRPSQFTCPKCGGHSFGSHTDEAGWVRYCNGRGQRIRITKDLKAVPVDGPDEPQIRCDFTWPASDDLKYGLKPPAVE